MITLYGMPSACNLKQLSPFVVKVEMALLYLELEYEVKHTSLRKIPLLSPTGKVPWIRVGNVTLSESDSIIAFLNDKACGALFDGLTNDQQVLGLALKRLTEDHLYWLMVWAKWISDTSRAALAESLFNQYPRPIKMMISAITKRRISARCKSQGIGSMNEEERGNEAVKDLSALSDQLQKMPFLLGSDITVYDFSVAAMLSSITFFKPCNWLSDVAKDYSIFPEYLERVRDRLGGYEFVQV